MTLKEFSAEYLPLPDARLEGEAPRWRKVLPTNLRTEDERIGTTEAGWFTKAKPIYKEVLKEQWERVHKGEIIDREWRKVYEY